jgi:hypothetical protein
VPVATLRVSTGSRGVDLLGKARLNESVVDQKTTSTRASNPRLSITNTALTLVLNNSQPPLAETLMALASPTMKWSNGETNDASVRHLIHHQAQP